MIGSDSWPLKISSEVPPIVVVDGALKKNKNKNPNEHDENPAIDEQQQQQEGEEVQQQGEGSASGEAYTIDAAKRMKYEQLFPVEAKKFGYQPKTNFKSVEDALDDRVKKKADRYCK